MHSPPSELVEVLQRAARSPLTASETRRLTESVRLIEADQRFLRFRGAMVREQNRLTASLTRTLLKEFRGLGAHVATFVKDVPLLESAATDKQAEKWVASILTASKLDKWRKDRLGKTLEDHYMNVARGIVRTTTAHMKVTVGLPDPVSARIVREGGTRLGLIDIEDNTRAALFRALGDAREQGLGPPAAARRVRHHVPAGRFVEAGPKYRAELIARTETAHAQRMSSIEIYKAADTIVAMRAYDNLVGFNDEDCVARDGVVMSFEDAEAEDGNEHPNGTLGFGPVVKGEE